MSVLLSIFIILNDPSEAVLLGSIARSRSPFSFKGGGLGSKHQYYVEEIVSQITVLTSGILPPQLRTRTMLPVAVAIVAAVFAVIGFFGHSD